VLDFIQQVVGGIALGCVYGLIALGFVLIYKATEVVNFAQGDLMMLGGFFAYTFIAQFGFNYWIGFALAVLAMAAFGSLVERAIVRPILGYPQFSIVMVTIGRRSLAASAASRARSPAVLSSASPKHFPASTCRKVLRTLPLTFCSSSC
jgi:branched-subunit amino acid ABC-type transport system permease component